MFKVISALVLISSSVVDSLATEREALPYNSKQVTPLATNVAATEWISEFNPRMILFNGCAPLTRYDGSGLIKYTNVPYDDLKTCKDLSTAQIYGKHHWGTGMYVYAWYGVVDHPPSEAYAYKWQFMAVISNGILEPGMTLPKINAIWTAVDGYTTNFFADYPGKHPWIDQRRPRSDIAAGMYTGHFSDGHILPLIDVTQRVGSWSAEAFDELLFDEECPLGETQWPYTVELIQKHPKGIGYPQL